MKEIIAEYLKNILSEKYDIQDATIKLETPPKKDMGDMAFGCFLLAKQLKKSPGNIAEDIKQSIENDENKIPEIGSLQVEGPYLNIYLASESYAASFENMLNSPLYPDAQKNKDELVYVDYIGANVGKPLHIGHMCTPLQGQSIINLHKKLGYTVISDSHIGDWGIIFGKLIVAYERYGDEIKLADNAVEHLFDLYVKISADAEKEESLDSEFRAAFQKLSSGDSELKETWARFTSASIATMNTLLSRLFVYPDYNIGESFYEGLGLDKMENYPDLTHPMHAIVDELIEKNIATKNDDGSVGVVFPDELNIPSCILQKRDGTHGYLASDLASVKYRMENWSPKKILYFVDVRQQLHFKQAFMISKLAGWIGDNDTEITHAHNGFISLKDGAMSTRKGKIIKLEKLLDEGEKRAGDIIKEKRSDISLSELNSLSKIIGVGAIKYGYLKKTRTGDSIFDWDEYMSFEGNSGPYIQYAYVRAQKILRKSEETIEYKNLCFTQDEEKNLLKHVLKFPTIIETMSREYYPHILCQYIYELTKYFSSFYSNVEILGEPEAKLRLSRLALLAGFSKILEESFDILAIPLPEEM